LRAEGVEAEQKVGLMVERSLEMMVGVYGILKAGGAYVPIDPSLPEERIRFMLEDSGAQVLLTQGHLQERVSFEGKRVILDAEESYSEDGANLEPVAGPRNVAYVIYTSGTTGKPKGVMVEHHSVINRLMWMQKAYPIASADTILQKTAITFDVSVWELFWWSWVGSKVCLLPVGGEKNPEEIVETIARNNVSTLHFVPSMLDVFLEYVGSSGGKASGKLASLRQVFASGEALTPAQVSKFRREVGDTRLINLYGPTEATVDVSYYECTAGE
ncbi:non-ribosomal peptide synthetase, partial [Paenibacillus elgii]